MNRENLLKKYEKQDKNDSFTFVLTYYPAVNKVQEILKKTSRHTVRSPRLRAVFLSPPRVTFRNPKALKGHLVRSKLKIRDSNDDENGIYKCDNINCDMTRKKYHINLKFDCNSINVIYLLTFKRCRKQYVGSTVTKFQLRFNQYKSNI